MINEEGATDDDGVASSCAAESGRLDILKYLRKEGVPFDSLVCESAIEGGQFEVLKWLKSNEVI